MKIGVVTIVIILLSVGTAFGDTIGPNCSTCNGATYALTYNPTPVASDATSQTFAFWYTIDVQGFNAAPTGSTVYIYAIGLKPSSSILDPSLVVAAPGQLNDWSHPMVTGSLSNNACQDNAGNAFACAQAVSLGNYNSFVVGQSGSFTWELDIRMATGTLTTADSIKAEFVNGSGTKVGSLLSEDITASVPESSSLGLLSAGLLGIGLAGWRRGQLLSARSRL